MNKKQLEKELNKLEVTDSLTVSKFLKNTNCYKNYLAEAFWNSSCTPFLLKNISRDKLWNDVLWKYFSKNENANEAVFSEILKVTKQKMLIDIIKGSKAYQYQNHWITFKSLRISKELNYKRFFKEIKFVKEFSEYWESLTEPILERLLQYSKEDVLVQTTFYFERLKGSNSFKRNQLKQTSYKASLINLINEFLELDFKGQNSSTNGNTFTYHNSNKKLEDFTEILEFFLTKNENEYQINKYLAGLAEFEEIENLEALIYTNKHHSFYRKTLEKGNYEEIYITNLLSQNKIFTNKLKDSNDFWYNRFYINNEISLNYFKFYNLPLSVTIQNEQINIEDILDILNHCSLLFYKDLEEDLVKRIHLLANKYKKLGAPDLLVSFNLNVLIENVSIFFNLSKRKSEIIINFLTSDTNSKKKSIDIKNKPFIKIGQNIFWVSSFLNDRKWSVALHRNLIKQGYLNDNIVAANSEKFIAELFNKAGFNAIPSHRYRVGNLNGEIDTLAFKDNILFLVELKNTYLEENMLRNNEYAEFKFKKLASSQLDKAKRYIQNNFEEIIKIEELNVNCKLSDLKIETLIVSNIFQSDEIKIKDRHLKVSLFELAIILLNDLSEIFKSKIDEYLLKANFGDISFQDMERFNNRNNPYIKPFNNISENLNLWSNPDFCSASDLIDAVVKNKVFQHLDNQRYYPREEIELKKYDPNDKHLK
jgi:hypothetical protein